MSINVGDLAVSISSNAKQVEAEVARLTKTLGDAERTQQRRAVAAKAAVTAEKVALKELKAARAEMNAAIGGRMFALGKSDAERTAALEASTAAQKRLTVATREYQTAVVQSKAAALAASGGAGVVDTLKDRVRIAKEQMSLVRQVAKTEREENRITQDGWIGRWNDKLRKMKAAEQAHSEQERLARNENKITQDQWMSRRQQQARVEKAHSAAVLEYDRLEKAGNKATQTEWEQAHFRREFMLRREIQAYAEDASRHKAKEAKKRRDSKETERQRLADIRARERAEVRAARNAAIAQRRAAVSGRRGSVAMSGAAMGTGLSTLGVTGTLVGTLGVHEVFRAAEAYQLLQARLAQVTETSAEANILFRELSDAAVALRVPVADATELFVKLRQSNANVNMSYGETIRVTRAFSAALRISGATGQTASSALLQFGQAMAKGNLDGDEFRTIAENNSEVLRVLADYLNESGIGAKLMGEGVKVGRGELLKLREEGKITSKMLADALNGDLQRLETMATKLAPTMTQAMTNVRNSFVIAIGGSNDLQQSFGNIAKSISSIGDAVRENTPLITSIAKWGAAFLVARTGLVLLLGAAKSVAYALGVLVSMHPVVRALTLIAGAAVYLAGRMDYLASKTAKANAQLREAQSLKPMSEQAADFKKARDRLIEAQRAAAGIRPTTMIGDKKRLKQELADAQNTFNAVYSAYRDTYDKMALLDSGRDPNAPGVVPPTEESANKAATDTTDQFIRDMDALTAAGLHTEAQMARLNRIFAESKIAMMDADPSVAAKALSRYAEITEVFGNLVNKTTDEVVEQASALDLLLENYGLLVDMGKDTVDQSQLIEEMYEEKKAELAQLNEVTEEYITLLKEVQRLEELLRTERNTPTSKKPAADPMTDAERRMKALQRQLYNILAGAPGELTVDLFSAIGQKIADGTVSIGEKMRQAFGNLFGNIGQSLIQNGFQQLGDHLLKQYGGLLLRMGKTTGVFGKLLTKLSAALANPLIAGPAMIAIGAAMVAFGSAMGGIGRGGTGDVLGGTIGGLGIGGEPQDTLFRFADRPYQSPSTAGAALENAASPVVVNATIIGANDPQAQREIGKLVDNAARRGLMNGSRGRVG